MTNHCAARTSKSSAPVEISFENSSSEDAGCGSNSIRLATGNLQVDHCVSYMMQQLNKPLKISVLIELAGITHSRFFAVFKSSTGYTPLDFFIRLRMQKARELLSTNRLLVKEVSYLVGYKDALYFSRMFKSIYGIAPSGFRTLASDSANFDTGQKTRLAQ